MERGGIGGSGYADKEGNNSYPEGRFAQAGLSAEQEEYESGNGKRETDDTEPKPSVKSQEIADVLEPVGDKESLVVLYVINNT